jgi:hypothetical protein
MAPVTPDQGSRRAAERAAASIDDPEHRALLVADLATLPA